jgi:hypothetical protein
LEPSCIIGEVGFLDRGLSLRIPVSLFLALVLRKAQFSILTCKLIAVFASFAKAVKVAFLQLLPMNDFGNERSKAGIANRGGEIIRAPLNDSIFFPLFAAFDTFHPQFSRVILHSNLELLHLILKDN